jgi:signal transduction histidine kinase
VQIDGDSEQLEQVVAQLCTNARTAMLASPVKQLSVRVEATSEGATLTVSDTGKGIAAENLTRIFEPFFTTKDVWTNIGLGLAVAYRVVQEHEGRLEVQSEPGKGARFTIFLKATGTTNRHAGGVAVDVGGQGKGITG